MHSLRRTARSIYSSPHLDGLPPLQLEWRMSLKGKLCKGLRLCRMGGSGPVIMLSSDCGYYTTKHLSEQYNRLEMNMTITGTLPSHRYD